MGITIENCYVLKRDIKRVTINNCYLAQGNTQGESSSSEVIDFEASKVMI